MLENATAQEIFDVLIDLQLPDNPFETELTDEQFSKFNEKYIEMPNRKFKDTDDMQTDLIDMLTIERENAFIVGFEIAKAIYSIRQIQTKT